MKKIPEVVLRWKPKKVQISQVYSEGLEYAFVTKDWRQVSQLVFCKDFLQDTLCAHYNDKKMSIYGFSYSPKTGLPLYLEKTRILVTNWRDKTLPNRIEGSIDFLNQIEAALKMVKTKIYKVTELPSQYKKAGGWVYEGSKRWMHAPPMISLYTLLIRVSLSHTVGDKYQDTIDKICKGTLKPYQSNDSCQLREALDGLNRILSVGDRTIFAPGKIKTHFKDVGVYVMHESCGICGFSSKTPKYQFPEWFDSKKKVVKKAPKKTTVKKAVKV